MKHLQLDWLDVQLRALPIWEKYKILPTDQLAKLRQESDSKLMLENEFYQFWLRHAKAILRMESPAGAATLYSGMTLWAVKVEDDRPAEEAQHDSLFGFFFSGHTCLNRFISAHPRFTWPNFDPGTIPPLSALEKKVVGEICAAMNTFNQAEDQSERYTQQLERQFALFRERPDLYRQFVEETLQTYHRSENYYSGLMSLHQIKDYQELFGIRPPAWVLENDPDKRITVSFLNYLLALSIKHYLPLPEEVTVPEYALRRNYR